MKVTEEGTETLFQQYSIKEVQEVERKLRNDIEKKKEDLRQMVGERYQDLINAADTITEMKASTESICNHISSMENWCTNVYSKMGPSGILQKCTATSLTRHCSAEPRFMLASHLKLIMDVPRLLWQCLDECQYLRASQIQCLAEHVHLSLTLDPEGQFHSVPLLSSFPILTQQMATIRKFKNTILQQAWNDLKKGHVTEDVLVDVVCSMLLLEDTSLERIFQEFLQIRMNTIKDIKESVNESSTIKDQICQLIGLITNTMTLIDRVFLLKTNSDEPSLLVNTFESITNSEEPGPIRFFNVESTPTYKYLPAKITDFCPSLEMKCTTLPEELCYEKTQAWINEAQRVVHDTLVNLLCYVTSIKGLSAISDAVDIQMQELESSEWLRLCQHILHRDFIVYNELLQTVLVDRIKVLCQQRINGTFSDCQNHLLEILSFLRSNQRCSYDLEKDLPQYLWVESPEDVQNLTLGINSINSDQVLNPGTLAMKAYAYTPQVQSLCSRLDTNIENLLQDLKHFGNLVEDKDAKHRQEMDELRNYVKDILIHNIQKILKTIQEILVKNNESYIESCYPFLSRFSRGLTDLCPNIKSCFETPIPKSENKWQQVKTDILLISDEAFRKWGFHFTRKHLNGLKVALNPLSPHSFLQNTLEWDEIEIDEETEEGKMVKSVIRVPMQPSLFLTAGLFSICREINWSIGHVLPRSICQEIRVEALQMCLSLYESCLPALVDQSKSCPRFAQTVGLQLLFDVQFLAGFLSIKEKPLLLELTNKLVLSLEEVVDPFDLDVFHPHLQTNLTLALQRSTLLLGLLCQERSVSVQRLAGGRNQSFNLLPTTVGVGRFMTLPISSSKTEEHSTLPLENPSPKLSQGFASSPSLQSSSSSEPELSNVTKSYSFFSAMGASWFGGSST